MKSLFSSLLCASLLVFTVGCGKDNKSGSGGGVNPPTYQNLYNEGLSSNQVQVLQKNTQWFQGTSEGLLFSGSRRVVKKSYTYNTTPTCTQESFWIINYTKCTYNGSPTSNETILDGYLNFTQNGTAITAQGNSELNAVFDGSSGTLMNAVDLDSNKSVLTFLRQDGVEVSYLIDRAVHSSANPMRKTETSTSMKKEIIVTIF